MIVLRSLALFLRQATSNSPLPLSSQSLYSATPVWYMASSFATPEAYHAFETALQASSSSVSASRQWTPEGDKYLAGQFSFAQNFDEPPFTLHELSDISHANFGVSDPKASGVADRPEVIYVSVGVHYSCILSRSRPTSFPAFVAHTSSNNGVNLLRLRPICVLAGNSSTGNRVAAGYHFCRNLPHTL